MRALEGGGILGGFPLMKIKVTILGGEARPDSSNEMAFRIAAGEGFEQALRQAGPVLLEPVMKLEILTPEEFLGDFVGDLQQRKGTIARTETRDKLVVIDAPPAGGAVRLLQRHAQSQPGPRQLFHGTAGILPRAARSGGKLRAVSLWPTVNL